MPIYWSILIISFVFLLIDNKNRMHIDSISVHKEYNTPIGIVLFLFLYLFFFVSLRDDVLDTYTYILLFDSLPISWSSFWSEFDLQTTGKGFYLIAGFFKILISDNHYVWLAFLCFISLGSLIKIYYERSINFTLSFYLFIASCSFTWLINGIRQFVAVCILFLFSYWLLHDKKFKYILLIILMSFIHSSCIFLIPITMFVSAKEVLGRKMLFVALLTIVGTIFSDRLMGVAMSVMDKDYSDAFSSGSGSSFIRLLVSAVPIFIVLFFYKRVKILAPPAIILAVNMSFIGVCFFFASTFTNGILIGRMPIYFMIYNFYLFPWLLKNCFRNTHGIITALCIVFYGFYFYYQMCIAWHGLPYVSDILNLKY